jgi:hypothetical protein
VSVLFLDAQHARSSGLKSTRSGGFEDKVSDMALPVHESLATLVDEIMTLVDGNEATKGTGGVVN